MSSSVVTKLYGDSKEICEMCCSIFLFSAIVYSIIYISSHHSWNIH